MVNRIESLMMRGKTNRKVFGIDTKPLTCSQF